MKDDTNTSIRVDADKPNPPPDEDREELNEFLEWILDLDDPAQEEAGYGHGV